MEEKPDLFPSSAEDKLKFQKRFRKMSAFVILALLAAAVLFLTIKGF